MLRGTKREKESEAGERKAEPRRDASFPRIKLEHATRIHTYVHISAAASVWAFPLCLAGDNRNKRAAEKGRRAADEQGCRMVMRATHPCVPVIPMTPRVDAEATAATRCRRGHCLSAGKLGGGAPLFCASCEEMR